MTAQATGAVSAPCHLQTPGIGPAKSWAGAPWVRHSCCKEQAGLQTLPGSQVAGETVHISVASSCTQSGGICSASAGVGGRTSHSPGQRVHWASQSWVSCPLSMTSEAHDF